MEKQIRWLYEELPKWVEHGLIDAPTADRLRVHYGEVAAPKSTWAVIWPILAMICIAIGILLLASSQWYEIARDTRLGWLLGLTALSLLGIAGTMALRPTSTALREAVGAFHAIMLPGAFWLADSMYTVNCFNEWQSVIGAAVLLLPMVYLLRSVVAASVYVLLAASFCATVGAEQVWFGKQLVWILLAAAAPYFYLLYKDGSRGKEMLLFGWSYGAAVYGAYFGTLLDVSVVSLAFFAVMATLTLYVGLLPGRHSVWGIPFRWIGGAAFVGTMLLATMRAMWVDIGQETPTVWPMVMLLLVLFATGAVWWSTPARRSPLLTAIALFPVLVLLGTIAAVFQWGYTFIAVVMMAYYLAATGWMLWQGIGRRSLGQTDIGLVMAGLFILARLADSQFTDYERGIAFVVIGLAVLAAHLVLKMRLSRRDRSMRREVRSARRRVGGQGKPAKTVRREVATPDERPQVRVAPQPTQAPRKSRPQVPQMPTFGGREPVMPKSVRVDHEDKGGTDHEDN